MGTVRQRRKTKNPSARTRRTAPKLRKPNTPKDVKIMAMADWDSEKTFDQNYAANSLVQNPNHRLSSVKTQNNLVKHNAAVFAGNSGSDYGDNSTISTATTIFRPLPQEPSPMSNIIYSKPSIHENLPNHSSSSSKLIASLEEASKIKPVKIPKPVSKDEQSYFKSLQLLYGDDFHRMQMDHKRNYRQLCSSELQRLFERIKQQPEDLFF